MHPLDVWEGFITFMESGGYVLTVIFVAMAVMWTLILERIWYFWRLEPTRTQETIDAWNARVGRLSHWACNQLRKLEVSRAKEDAERSLGMIKSMVMVAPMLGLFGTVAGMIQVFDVMAVAGNGNPRAMAAGISQAILTTMAGMVAALSGLYPSIRLERRARASVQNLEDHLVHEEDVTVSRRSHAT